MFYTPDRLDKVNLSTIFGSFEVPLTLQEAMDKNIIAKIRAFRINTNLNLSNIRYKGKDFVNSDLEKYIAIDSRDYSIVKVLKRYFHKKDKKCVIFCINISHAERINRLLKSEGFNSISVSSKNKNSQKLISDFRNGKYNVICSCGMLNEGWDDNSINVLVMARPTLSKVLYMQQLGRGLRKTDRKKEVFVLDVVDQYGSILKPWSAHAIFNFNQYVPFAPIGNVYRSGELFELFGYNETITSIQEIDINTFEKSYENYLSTEQCARELFISTGSLISWIRNKSIKPDLSIPFGKSFLHYFKKESIESIRQEKKLKLHSEETIKADFFEFINEKQFTFSFKIVFLLSLLEHLNINGDANIDSVLQDYTNFYKKRIINGLPVDRNGCVYDKDYLNDNHKMKRSMLENPFEKFERKRFIFYGNDISQLSFNPLLWEKLDEEDLKKIKTIMQLHLTNYFNNLSKA